MSGSFAKNKSASQQRSRSLSANAVANYFTKLNQLSDGNLSKFAQGGSEYKGLAPGEIKSLGGHGATRINKLTTERDRVNADYGSDASLSLQQKLRASQLNNEAASSAIDSVAKETEAAVTDYAANNQINKANMKREDLTALANIFFGGKGQSSSGSSKAKGFRVAGGVGGS